MICMCVSDITSPSAIASGAQGMLALNVQARLHRLVYLCVSLCVSDVHVWRKQVFSSFSLHERGLLQLFEKPKDVMR